MGNIFNEDFRDFIAALNQTGVRYILVGGFSVILHGYSRTTGDIDIWVERSTENYTKIKQAFQVFGMPVFDMNEENFLHHPNWEVFTFGIPPTAIDMMISVKGLDFNTSYEQSTYFEEDGLMIRTIHLNDLITAKRTSARPKDLDDLDNLSKK
ncbi:nucleotidyltransferase [Mucilaginibacter sp. AW1-3]